MKQIIFKVVCIFLRIFIQVHAFVLYNMTNSSFTSVCTLNHTFTHTHTYMYKYSHIYTQILLNFYFYFYFTSVPIFYFMYGQFFTFLALICKTICALKGICSRALNKWCFFSLSLFLLLLLLLLNTYCAISCVLLFYPAFLFLMFTIFFKFLLPPCYLRSSLSFFSLFHLFVFFVPFLNVRLLVFPLILTSFIRSISRVISSFLTFCLRCARLPWLNGATGRVP